MSDFSWRRIDPSSPHDVAELKAQRVACGWDEDKVDHYLSHSTRGNLCYFFFTRQDGSEGDSREVVLGSGALDLSGIQNGEEMASHERKEFCLMGLFLWSRYRGAGLFRRMTEVLLTHGFETLDLRSATVMTLRANQVTNGMFQGYGFEVYLEVPRPEWKAENAYGLSLRVSRDRWRERMQSLRKIDF